MKSIVRSLFTGFDLVTKKAILFFHIIIKEVHVDMDTILFLHVFQSRKNKAERAIAATFASGSSDHTTTNVELVKTKLLEQEVAEQVHSSVIAEPKRYNDPHPSH